MLPRGTVLSPDELRFHARLDSALHSVHRLLKAERSHGGLPMVSAHGTVAHDWSDKYLLAQSLTNTALAAQFNALALLGVQGPSLRRMHRWAAEQDRPVTLRFESEERCRFEREITHEVPSDTKVVTTGLFGSTQQVVTTVHEFHFRVSLHWRVRAYAGEDPDAAADSLLLSERSAEFPLITHSRQLPRPDHHVQSPRDVSITWMLQQVLVEENAAAGAAPSASALDSAPLQFNFTIDRSALACRTPRRNPQSQAALAEGAQLYSWAEHVSRYFMRAVFPVERSGDADASKRVREFSEQQLYNVDVFIPILPLFQQTEPRKAAAAADKAMSKESSFDARGGDAGSTRPRPADEANCAAGPPSFAPCAPAAAGSRSPLLSNSDVSVLLSEQRRTLTAKVVSMRAVLPAPATEHLLTLPEAQTVLATVHLQSLLHAYTDALGSIESALRAQLVAAIGSELSAHDFDGFMRTSHPRLFRPDFQPVPFVFAVRRPDHAPEGTVSISNIAALGDGNGAEVAQPVHTYTRTLSAKESLPMSFRLSAATIVRFTGSQQIHAYVPHAFGGSSLSALSLECRSRAFSSYLVVLGTFRSGSELDPTHAFILQNQDDLKIPLLLEQLPSAGEFARALESMSPAQQRFAQAIRSLQLSGSLFGLLVVQLKPQLERLLRLPADSLTKEVALTQQLLELFIKYQIPSDLLSFDDTDAVATPELLPIVAVKAHAAAIKTMIQAQEDLSLAQAKKEQEYVKAQREAAERPQPKFLFGATSMPRLDALRATHLEHAPQPLMDGMDGGAATAVRTSMPPASDMMTHRVVESAEAAFANSPPPPSDQADSAKPANPQQPEREHERHEGTQPSVEVAGADGVDVTTLPARLDAALLARERARTDTEMDARYSGSLRSTKVRIGAEWTKRSVQSLLSRSSSTVALGRDAQQLERSAAFDLLDALSRSGALSLQDTDLHVLLALTHQFDRSIVDALTLDNVNPIEKLEDALASIVATIHELPEQDVLQPVQWHRLQQRRAIDLANSNSDHVESPYGFERRAAASDSAAAAGRTKRSAASASAESGARSGAVRRASQHGLPSDDVDHEDPIDEKPVVMLAPAAPSKRAAHHKQAPAQTVNPALPRARYVP